jgi:hypothetical protein
LDSREKKVTSDARRGTFTIGGIGHSSIDYNADDDIGMNSAGGIRTGD